MRRLLVAIAIGSMLLAGCESTGEDQLGEAKVTGKCPGVMFVGLPEALRVSVTNTGSEDWPAAFVQWDGLDDFVINGATAARGGRGEDVGHGSYRFGPLAAGARNTYTLLVTPKEAGNPDLEFAVWGDKSDAIPIPTSGDIDFYECTELAVNP